MAAADLVGTPAAGTGTIPGASTAPGAGTAPTNTGVLGQPGAAEVYNSKNSGLFSQPTNSQTLFSSEMGGSLNPAYQNSANQANADINRQMASRGLFGSSAAGRAVALSDANLFGQQATQINQAGSLADQSNMNQLSTGGTLANNAQTQQTSRLTGGLTALSGLGSQLSATSQTAIAALNSSDQATLTSAIQAGTITPAQIDAAAGAGSLSRLLGGAK